MEGLVHLVAKNPQKAYIDNMLWLPKWGVSELSLKANLEFEVADRDRMIPIRLWRETDTHIGVPREFIRPEDYRQYPFSFVDICPRVFPRTNIVSKVKSWRNPRQEEAYRALSNSPGGILNLGCGKGKTVLALHRVAEVGCPSLVIVHNTFLLNQWKERIEQHLELPAGERIGTIQGPEMDWHHPITIGMIHTLAARARDNALPPEMSRYFGMAIYDEVHHLGAPLFSLTADLVLGLRYGLTATATRLDGLEFVYKYHLGPVFYTDTEQDLIPRTYFQLTPTQLDLTDESVLDSRGDLNIPKLRSALADNDTAVNFRYRCIKEAYDSGRKIMALSHSKKLLFRLAGMFPESGVITEETPQSERTEVVRRSKIVFAIARLGVEGLDDARLDTLFHLTPFSSPNDLEQSFGRIQRALEGKNHPVAIIFEDVYIPPFKHLCKKLRAHLRDKGYPYQTLGAPNFT